MQRLVKNGTGWRLGWNPQAEIYQGLIGTDDWAIELTIAELRDFKRLLVQLAKTMEQMAGELMDAERISCEAETELLWLEVEGYPHAYSLRVIVHNSRRCEGNWAAGVAPHLLSSLETIDLN